MLMFQILTHRPYRLFYKLSAVFIVLIASGAFIIGRINIENRHNAHQEQTLAADTAQVVEDIRVFNLWLSDLTQKVQPIVSNVQVDALLRKLVNKKLSPEMAATRASHHARLTAALNFARKQYGLRTAMLIDNQARMVAYGGETAGSFSAQSIASHGRALQTQKVTLGDALVADGRTYIEVFIPISFESDAKLGVLYLQADISDLLTRLMTPEDRHQQTYVVYLSGADNMATLLAPGKISQVDLSTVSNTGVMEGLMDAQVFRTIRAIPDNKRYMLVHETDYGWAMKDFAQYKKLYVRLLAFQALAGIILFMGLLWYGLSRRDQQRARHLSQMSDALIKAIEVRDPYLGGHHERFARLSLQVGQALGLNVPDRATLFYAAKLSGIGRIFIPKAIMNKETKLTKEERAVIEQQVENTMAVLEGVDFDLPIKQVIRQMYERGDGSGYPNKLTLGDIDLRAQILGVCDVFCAMTRPRTYRKALPPKEVLARLDEMREQFSPLVVSALMKVLEDKYPQDPDPLAGITK